MKKPVILTGLRANNDLHIGNYLGALLPMVDMANQHAGEYQINLFVPDLHSFTTPVDHSKLQAGIMNALKMFVAAGLPLDNPDIHIYRQSYIPAHSELTWILDCFTGFGEMSRMTQFKDKSRKLYAENSDIYNEEFGHGALHDTHVLKKKQKDILPKLEQRISVGLFNYPVLMAADIILYGATYVPVGDDQSQHLEFTRDIAERMNNQFGKLFVVPKPVKQQHIFFGKDQGLRIKDLVEPKKKMSKSDDTGKGVIFLSDTPQAARKKIMGATTDSYGRVAYNQAEQPGIANLIDLLALFSGKSLGEVCKEFVGQEQYGPLKTAAADAICGFLESFQEKLDQVDTKALLKSLESSEALMRKQAEATLSKVQVAVGLRPAIK